MVVVLYYCTYCQRGPFEIINGKETETETGHGRREATKEIEYSKQYVAVGDRQGLIMVFQGKGCE